MYKNIRYKVSSESENILMKNMEITNAYIMDIYDKLKKARKQISDSRLVPRVFKNYKIEV